jgi:hypothetical protein
MVSDSRCRSANLVGVFLLNLESFLVHFIHELRFRCLTGPMGGHVLQLVVYFLKNPERRLIQQLRGNVVEEAL